MKVRSKSRHVPDEWPYGPDNHYRGWMSADDLTVSGGDTDEPGGDVITGPDLTVPPGLIKGLAVVGVMVLAGVGATFVQRGGAATVRYPLAVPSPAVEEFIPRPAVAVTELPADLVFGAGDTTVLVDRDRRETPLPPGGPVTAAVKVPSGWVVGRDGRVLHVRDDGTTDLPPGPTFHVDVTGTRVLIDRGGGRATVWSIPAGRPEVSTDLPAHVRVVGWLGAAVLLSVRDDEGRWRYDRWFPGGPYEEAPSTIEGNFLGVVGEALVLHQRDGTLDCVVRVPDLFRPIGPALRCGFGVTVDGELPRGRWEAVSPGGGFAAVPGPNGSVHVASLPAMLGGRAGFASLTGLPGPVVGLIWRDAATVAVLVRGDVPHIWSCVIVYGTGCRSTPLNGPAGLTPLLLATRQPPAS